MKKRNNNIFATFHFQLQQLTYTHTHIYLQGLATASPVRACVHT